MGQSSRYSEEVKDRTKNASSSDCQQGNRTFSFPKRPGRNTLLFNGYRGSLLGGKRPECDAYHAPPSSRKGLGPLVTFELNCVYRGNLNFTHYIGGSMETTFDLDVIIRNIPDSAEKRFLSRIKQPEREADNSV